MARSPLFMKVAQELYDLPVDDTEEGLRTFYKKAKASIRRVTHAKMVPWDTPGFHEWCEFHARIVASWTYYFNGALKRRPSQTKERELLAEVLGLAPRKGRERWYALNKG